MQTTEFVHGGVHSRLNRFGIGDIGKNKASAVATGFGERGAGLRIDIGNHDISVIGSQAGGAGSPQTRGSAGNQKSVILNLHLG